MNLLAIQWNILGIVLGIFLGVALLFCILILVVTRICKVDEDKKVEAILSRLGGSNCGGCGCSGCAAFASKLASGEGNVQDCHATTPENIKEIASILGVVVKDEEPTVAVVKCIGGENASDSFVFSGYTDCATLATTFQGGNKVCATACLGGGDCMSKCDHDAISTEGGVAKIDASKCGSCGGCIIACPKKIIERIPRSAPVYVACSTKCKGKAVMGMCKVGCIGCGLCAKNCAQGAITMVDGLPVFDYSKCNGCKTCVTKCPRKVIIER